jgi:glycosyltransferase involved in cell wall biosynthesis
MDNPHVSVLLPVRNGERYLTESIDSVLAQRFTDFELLVCDDGSTDGTAAIIEAQKDERIRVFRNRTHRGLFTTINNLIRESRGSYVRLWSCDDSMVPYCLEEEARFCRDHPEVGFCYCARDIIDEEGRTIVPWPEDRTPDIVSPRLAAQILFYHGSMPGNIASVTIRKSVLVDDVGFFREDMKQSGDFEMWVRLSKTYPIGFIGRPLIRLRKHSGQFSLERGAGLAGIRENRGIFNELMTRLPPDVVPHAKKYHRWCHHTQYVHYMFRSLLAGDFRTARDVCREIGRIDNLFAVILIWLVTVNNRLYRVQPVYHGGR